MRDVTRRQVLQWGLATGAGLALGPQAAARADASGAPRPAAGPAPRRGQGPGSPRHLTVSGMRSPVGVDPGDVWFAWQLDDPRRGALQTAYRIVVSRPRLAGPGAGTSAVVWDSGRVSGPVQAFVPYGGPALAPDTSYDWTVQTWDATGRAGPAASRARFDTGLRDGDWHADWIRRLTVEPQDNPTTFGAQSTFGVWLNEDEFSYLRREVVLGSSPVVRARAYVSADQLYELYVNGALVGKGQAYQFPDSQYYEAWDVTPFVRAGRSNAFGILHTWQGPAKGHPAGSPGVIARISILHADGSTETVTTDATWRTLPGAWLPGTQRDEEGDPVDYTENIDGPAIPEGWDRPGYLDAGWAPATVLGRHPTEPWSRLVAVRTRMAFEAVPAVSLTRLSGGAVVADFGRVFAAIPSVTFRHGVPGRAVTMHAGYLLDEPSGTVSTSRGTQHTNMSYSYIQRGGIETFRPFDYLGFRFLQLDNPGEDLDRADVVAFAKHVAVPDEHAATFESSDPVIDAVFELGRHSALYSMQEQFVDTPTREKGSWLWDGRNESATAMAAFGDQNQTRKSLVEFAQSQARYWPDGAINKIYPTALGAQQIPYFTAIYPDWAWNYWMHTGDAGLLASLYPVLTRVSDYLWRAVDPATGLIGPLSGASDVPMHPTDTMMNLLAVNAFRRVAAVGTALGRPAVETGVQSGRQAQLAQAVNRRLARADGLYSDGLDGAGNPIPVSSQRTNAYALAFGVVPTRRTETVGRHVAAQGMATEPMCAGDVLEAMRLTGHDVAVARILSDRRQPGWARILARGGTFTWEVWDPQDSDVPVAPAASFYPGDSMSHGWGSNVLVAIQQHLLGVTPTAPGFATFDVTPPLQALSHAAGRVPTPAGSIEVAWSRSDGQFDLAVLVPANTSAMVRIPGADTSAVLEGGRAVRRAPGVLRVTRDGPYTAMTVGAGSYRFRSGA